MKKIKGFTLIELMIVVVIVAILLLIAVPNYRDYIRKARRADGMDALMTIQNFQERYRANNPGYGLLTDIGYTGTESLEGYYELALALSTGTGTSTAVSSYTASASGEGDQANDNVDGTICTLVITVDADYPRGEKTPEDCW